MDVWNLANLVYERSDLDYKTFTIDGMKLAEEKTASALHTTDRDLKAYKARGGKEKRSSGSVRLRLTEGGHS
jgi:hypothetical protein